MHITLETDYAIRIMDCLGSEQRRMGAQSIADKTGVTLRFSLKILRKLVKSEMLRSFKGAHGGYEIAKALKDISINDILETIEGPYQFSRCLDMDHQCMRRDDGLHRCPYHIVFGEISKTVQERLKATTLDQFIQPNF